MQGLPEELRGHPPPTSNPGGNSLTEVEGLSPESQGQHLASTISYVPYSFDGGHSGGFQKSFQGVGLRVVEG